MHDEPKLCPFCGSDKIKYEVRSTSIKKIGRRYFHYYFCKSCSASIKGRDQFDAMQKWNHRKEK